MLAAVLAAGLVQGVLPGLIFVEHIGYFSEGSVRCMHDLGLDALTSRCHAFGEPVGFPLLTGGPLIAVGAALMYLPGVDSLGALAGALVLFDLLGILGGFALMRRLGAGPWVALGTATAWVISPTVVGLGSFGGTLVGYVLLPAYAYMDLLLMDAMAGRGRRLAMLLVAYALVRTGALFMDGYSFVTSGLVGACLWTSWLLARDRTVGERVRGAAAFGAANLLALAVYSAYVPFDFPTEPIETFRGLGLDLVTVVEPSQAIWWASKLGVAVDHGATLWGDPGSVLWNYGGYVGLGLALWYLVRKGWRDRLVVALAAAGLVALALSLGPALKFDSPRASDAARYTMPKGAAPELPWAGIFTGLPGFKSMRATNRWFGMTRMALILLAGLAVAELARGPGRRRKVAALLLAGVAVAEVLPTVPVYLRIYRDRYEDRVQLREQVAEDLDRTTSKHERAFILSYNGAHNDFVVNYLASATGLRTYNVGGDKNVAYAMSAWPDEIRQLAPGPVPPAAVEQALRAGKVDVVVAPFFSLQTASDFWPPLPTQEAEARAAYAPLLAAPRVKVDRYRWFATLRLEGR